MNVHIGYVSLFTPLHLRICQSQMLQHIYTFSQFCLLRYLYDDVAHAMHLYHIVHACTL